jgi:hypothetical protein
VVRASTNIPNKRVGASLLNPAVADVELVVVGEETFPVLRVVLAASSPVFK